jgi:hypothetical protein
MAHGLLGAQGHRSAGRSTRTSNATKRRMNVDNHCYRPRILRLLNGADADVMDQVGGDIQLAGATLLGRDMGRLCDIVQALARLQALTKYVAGHPVPTAELSSIAVRRPRHAIRTGPEAGPPAEAPAPRSAEGEGAEHAGAQAPETAID